MANSAYEVVKEYVLWVDGLDFSVKGRILKLISKTGMVNEYLWEISHHYRPSETAAGVYYPSKLTTKSFGEAESLLFALWKGRSKSETGGDRKL